MADDATSLLSSAIGGVTGRLLCHPIDTIKSKLQASESVQALSLTHTVRSTVQREGVAGLYRGLSAVVVGSAPGVCVYITSYEKSKQALSSWPVLRDQQSLVFLASGMVAEAACCAVFIPIDVIKERLQVQSLGQSYHYNGSLDAFRQIMKHEGLRGLYKGYFATLASYGPFSAIYFSVYEKMKTIFHKSSVELSFLENLTSSAVAGGVASVITNPLEIAKLRYQIQVTPIKKGNEVAYRNVAHAFNEIFKTSGVKGLFRGAGTRILFHTPNTAITMATYEECKKYFTKLQLS